MIQTTRLTGKRATDNMDGQVKSLDGNRYAHLFSNETYFDETYPMAKKADAGQALKTFIVELGVPEELTVDGSKEQSSPGTKFMKCCWRNDISLTRTNPKRTNHNLAEGMIREVQSQWFQTMIRKGFPIKIWGYVFQ